MLDNLILVSVLGGVVGIGVGFFYKKVFILSLVTMSKIFFVHNFFKLISLLFACVFTFLFFLVGLIFSPIVSDSSWNYFYVSFFIGIMIGVKIENFLNK
ncbi:Uncharacterised protein [Acinetobacter baumannii]|uniref:hypothetical protein n=1 Tax=Acinetobacter baumannii TaxID=470 RepID=UPI000DE74BC1|nr:hypothetical protein [Acinetobacter baumannii]SSP29203.1 Uncharacterised protein [Acinetobacter baumannii]